MSLIHWLSWHLFAAFLFHPFLPLAVPPEYVTVTAEPAVASVGERVVIKCVTASSNPVSEISWWRDGILYAGIANTSFRIHFGLLPGIFVDGLVSRVTKAMCLSHKTFCFILWRFCPPQIQCSQAFCCLDCTYAHLQTWNTYEHTVAPSIRAKKKGKKKVEFWSWRLDIKSSFSRPAANILLVHICRCLLWTGCNQIFSSKRF